MSTKAPQQPTPSTGHGGRRPGAGAPSGNLNALKTGAHSSIVHDAVAQLLQDPWAGNLLMALLTLTLGHRRRSRHHLGLALDASATQDNRHGVL